MYELGYVHFVELYSSVYFTQLHTHMRNQKPRSHTEVSTKSDSVEKKYRGTSKYFEVHVLIHVP